MRFKSVLVLLLCTLFAACTSKAVKKEEKAGPQAEKEKLRPVSVSEMTDNELAQLKKILEQLEDIPFDFDKSSINPDALELLKKNVQLLNAMLEKRNRYFRMTLEGHADERGSEEYNLGLGERRAQSIKDYLLDYGFRDQSLHVLSYGEERPKISGSTPEAWAANRRVHFVVE